MKKRMSKIITFVVSFALVFTSFAFLQTEKVHGDNLVFEKYSSNITVVLTYNSMPNLIIDMGNKIKDNSKVKVQSNNKKMLSFSDRYGKQLDFLVKKGGTSNVTITVTTGGKKKVYKSKITIIPYKNPFKSFKVGNKQIKKQFKNWPDADIKASSKKLKINISPKKGWKIKSIKYKGTYSGDASGPKNVKKTIKNKDKIKVVLGNPDYKNKLTVKMYDTKNKKTFVYTVDIY